MYSKTEVHLVEIRRAESDEYSTDIEFLFRANDLLLYQVTGIYAAPDIFEIKAHTLSKILSDQISLPRTLDFGFHADGGRHVDFHFVSNDDHAAILTCTAFDGAWGSRTAVGWCSMLLTGA